MSGGRLARLRGGPSGDGMTVVGTMTIAAVLGVWRLGTESLWVDEAFSAAMARMPWSDFTSVVTTGEVNMVLYNAFLRGWSVLGWSEAMLRLPSVVFTCLSVPVLHSVARRLVDAGTARLSLLVFVLNGFVVAQSQEARAGALAILFTLLSTWLLLRWLEQPSADRALLYGLCAALGAYVHFFLLLVFVAHLPGIWMRRRTLRHSQLLAALGTALLFHAPLVAYFAFGETSQVDWIPSTTLSGVWRVWYELSGGAGRSLAAFCLLAVVAAGVEHMRRKNVDGWRTVLLWSGALTPAALALVISLHRPLIVPRYFAVLVPFLAMLVAAGVRSLRPGVLRFIGVALILVLGARSVYLWHTGDPREDWRALTVTVLERSLPGDVLVGYRPAIDYYVNRSNEQNRPEAAVGELPWGSWSATRHTYGQPDLDPSELGEHQGRRWIAVRIRAPGEPEVPSSLGAVVEEFEFSRLRLFLVTPTTAG